MKTTTMTSPVMQLSSASIWLITLASILPFSFILFDGTQDGSSTNVISTYNQGLSLLSMIFLKPHTSTINPHSILAANLQIHAINCVLLLMLSYQFLKTQRCYGHQIRETACMLAVMIFAVHPGRLEYLRRSDLRSVHHQFAICMSFIGVILSMHFLDSNKRIPYSIVQAILSGVFLSIGAFLGASISTVAIPLLFYAAIVLQQMRCSLSLFNAAILTISHGACAALVAHVHTNCEFTTSSFLSCNNTDSRNSKVGAYYASSSRTLMSKSFRPYSDALVNITTILWQEPLRVYAFLDVHANQGLIELTGLVNQFVRSMDTITTNGSSSSRLNMETMSRVYHELIHLVIPLLLSFLTIRVVVHCIYDAFRWKATTNFNFAYIALLVTILCSPPCAMTSLLDMDLLLMSFQSYIPSAFMSVCLAVALADAWAAQLLASKETTTAAGRLPSSKHPSNLKSSILSASAVMLPKGVLVTTAFRLLTVATFCLGMQSFMQTTTRPRSSVTTTSSSSSISISSSLQTKDHATAIIDTPAMIPIVSIEESLSLPEREEDEVLENNNIAFTAKISREL